MLPPGLNKLLLNSIVYVITFIVALLSVIPYTQSLYGDFVWDDVTLIKENSRLDDPDYLRQIWLSDFFDLTSKNQTSYFWRPLVRFSMWLDYSLFGLSPFHFHLTNLLLFGCTIAALFLLLIVLYQKQSTFLISQRSIQETSHSPEKFFRFSKISITASCFSCLIFAWHPLRTEIVAWISGRTEIMVLLFGIIALLCFRKGISSSARTSPLWLLFACISLSFSLLSKESGILFPLLALLVWPAQIKQRPVSYALFWIPVGAWAILRSFAVGYQKWFPQPTEPLFLPAAAGRAFLHYAKIHFLPLGLSPEPWFPLPNSYSDPSVIGGLLLMLLCILIIFFKRNAISIGAAWFVLTLSPFLHLLPLPERAADRYTTMASVGFAICAGGLFKLVWNHRFLRWSYMVFLTCVLATWSIMAHNLVPVWSSAREIIRRSADHGQSPQALFYRGDRAFTNRKYQEAYDAYTLSYQRSEQPSEVQLYHLALTAVELEKPLEAISYLEELIQKKPHHLIAGTFLGELYMRIGRFDDSIRIMTSQAQIHPRNPVPYLVMGQIYMDFLKEPERARDYLIKASQREPNDAIRQEINNRLVRLTQQ